MRFRMLIVVASLAAVVMLSGCTEDAPIVTPNPSSSVTPVFASDEEALAAATEAYAKYVAMADQIFNDGGKGASVLSDVATGQQLDATLNAFSDAETRGLHSVGRTTFDPLVLQQYDRASDGEALVTAYVCEDISGIDVFDSSGKSVVAPDRPNRVLYEVTFDLVAVPQHLLLLSYRVPWSEQTC